MSFNLFKVQTPCSFCFISRLSGGLSGINAISCHRTHTMQKSSVAIFLKAQCSKSIFFFLSLSPMNEDCATAPSKKHIMYATASLVCTRTSTDQTQSGLCKQMGCHVLYCCSSILIGWKCNGIRVWRQESVWFRGWLTGPQPLHSSLIVYLFIQKKNPSEVQQPWMYLSPDQTL